MKYTIEFELPNNKTIEDELQGAYVSWSIWGYSGVAKAKPVPSEELQIAKNTNVLTKSGTYKQHFACEETCLRMVRYCQNCRGEDGGDSD